MYFFVFQKSLWDTIKNKRGGEKIAAPRRKKMQPPLKMAPNKTFQVSRQPQYKRDKPRSPLVSLNEGKTVRERSPMKPGLIDSLCIKTEETLNPKQSLALSDQENIFHIQRSSPPVLLVPTSKLTDSSNMLASPDTLTGKPENKELSKMLNRTLSPIGTPEKFKKLMPHIQSESPLPAAINSPAPVLSLKDALALIDSDLSQVNASPRDTSSGCDFSDSLESNSGNHGCGSDNNVLKPLPDSPELTNSNEPRLTFFVSKKVVVSEVAVLQAGEVKEKVTKPSFTSATVTKCKAPVETNSLSGRKIKKSRRRLLEKTLELSDSSSQGESGLGTPSLPVIDSDARTTSCDDRLQIPEFTSYCPAPGFGTSPAPVKFPVLSPPPMAPSRFSFSATSPPPSVPAQIAFTITSPSPVGSSSPFHRNLFSSSEHPTASANPSVQEESFPVHVAMQSKKRKSEEYLKSDGKIEGAAKTEPVKRSKGLTRKTEPSRPVPERRHRAAGEQMKSQFS